MITTPHMCGTSLGGLPSPPPWTTPTDAAGPRLGKAPTPTSRDAAGLRLGKARRGVGGGGVLTAGDGSADEGRAEEGALGEVVAQLRDTDASVAAN